MQRILIVNASPLIHLAEAGHLDLLRDAGGPIWVPDPVAAEVRNYGANDPTARALAESAWISVRPAFTLAYTLAYNRNI